MLMNMIINDPKLWLNVLPRKTGAGHKYDYGHAFIYGAPAMTGATRLAAAACARIGAGLVTVLCAQATYDVYRSTLPAHIITRADLEFKHDKLSTRLYGCGGLPCAVDYDRDIPTVLDAAALDNMPDTLTPNYILTPHEGEFARTFPDIQGDRADKAAQAAQHINAVIVLKGLETIIAAPDGQGVINQNAAPVLATAGTGDVLAGMITGLTAQGMPPFDAACAAVWMHGEAGKAIGHGMVASDIELVLPKILTMLANKQQGEPLGFL